MAIYALSIKHQAKGKGATAKAHAQYIQREGKYREKGLYDAEPLAVAAGGGGLHVEYLAREGNYTRRAHELEASWSGNLPKWASTAKEFWSAADTYERANGTVYTEMVIAIPRELSKEGQEQVIRDFVDKELGERFPYTVSIHNPRALDGGEQPHAHVMFSLRELDGREREKELFFKRANPQVPELGGCRKTREWGDRKRGRVEEVRLSWERLANEALKREGHEVRIDRRSLKARGIEREAEPKMGPIVTKKLKRGEETEVGQKVVELRNYRKQEREVCELEEELKKEKARVLQFPDLRAWREEEGVVFSIKREGKAQKVSPEEKAKYQRTLDLVFKRLEKENGEVEFRWKRSGRVAFIDKGDEILFNSVNEASVKAGLQLAKEKGWAGVRVWGSEKFRRENWVQGQLMGISISGYDPRAEDFVLLKERKKALEQKRAKYRRKDKPVREKELDDLAPKQKKTKEQAKSIVVEVPASELELEFRRDIIPALEEAQRKIMDEFRALGYQGGPGYTFLDEHKRWRELPSDEGLRERAFLRLGGVTYKQQGESHKKALFEVAEREKQLEVLSRKEEDSFLRKISPGQILQKRRVSEELLRAKNWRDAARSNIEHEQLRLSTGRNKERFQQTLTYLTDQRRETEERRKAVEEQQRGQAEALGRAYALKRSLKSLGTNKVRFIREQGMMPRPENLEQFNEELKQARALERRRGRGRGLSIER